MNSLNEWNDYWKDNTNVDSLFTDSNGAAFEEFSVFWCSSLKQNTNSKSIIDLACGTGALFSSIGKIKLNRMAGLDCSPLALDAFNKKFPNAKTYLSEGTELPKEIIGDYDIVVSQFGIEYLGKASIIRLPEIMKPGAQFIALCHCKDGHIHSRYQKEREALELLFSKNSFSEAIALAESDPRDDDTIERMKNYASYLKSQKGLGYGGSQYYVEGVNQIFANFHAYHQNDVVNWIGGMEVQLHAAYKRICTITDVALSTEDIEEITSTAGNKLNWNVSLFHIRSSDLPSAWKLTYVKD